MDDKVLNEEIVATEEYNKEDSKFFKIILGKKIESVKLKKPCAIANIYNTEYSVIKNVMKNTLGYKLTTDENGEWDIFWSDCGACNEMLYKVKSYQKTNHFPSMGSLSRKNCLAKNLNRMKRRSLSLYRPRLLHCPPASAYLSALLRALHIAERRRLDTWRLHKRRLFRTKHPDTGQLEHCKLRFGLQTLATQPVLPLALSFLL